MSMYETILKTAGQFAFEPKIINEENLREHSGYVVVGMGGSYLAAGLVRMWLPEVDVIGHQDYGLPEISEAKLKRRLIIFSSYSGNTEEVIDAYTKAGEMGLDRVVITIGGKLLELAKQDGTAYIQMPDEGIQPRSALPLSLKSMLLILGQKEVLTEVTKLQDNFRPEKSEMEGRELAETLRGRVPIIYSASRSAILGYVWKITFNETGKIPAFCNVFPELDHNEIEGFGVKEATAELSSKFYFLFLWDDDNPKIRRRMKVTAKLFADRNLPSKIIKLGGDNKYLKFFNSRAVAEFAAFYSAKYYGLEAEQVPMVEELKKML